MRRHGPAAHTAGAIRLGPGAHSPSERAAAKPSAAYAVTPFGSTVHIVATGAGPHLSFAEPLSGRKRWGDYSAACMDPSTGAIWQAAEYIPPAASQDPFDNWGTDVFATKLG